MKQAIRSSIFAVIIFLVLGGCVTNVDPSLPFAQLPEISVATEFKLIASPSHPTAYLPVDPIPAGTHLQVVGRDKNAAWLLVLHDNILGWMPTFYSRDNLGTLSTAFTFEPLSDKCTSFLDATFGPDTAWDSTVEGGAIVLGSLYRPNTPVQTDNASLALQIEGAGQAVQSDYVYTALTASSSLVLFDFELTDLAKGSQIAFLLNKAESESLYFQAMFFSDSCADSSHLTNQLPVGVPKGLTTQPEAKQPTKSIATVQPVETIQPENTTIIHTSDARTPTLTPTPTPFPTVDSDIYGFPIPISKTAASSVFVTGSFPASNVVDGNIETVWVSNYDDDIGAWIELHLAKATRVTGVRIYSLGKRGGRGQPQKLTLRFSDNSQQVMLLGEEEGWTDTTLTPVTTESIRIMVEEVHDFSPFNTTQIPEIQVLGELEAPIVIESGQPAVSIRLRSVQAANDGESGGRLKVKFLRQDGQPLTQAIANIYGLEEDIAGDLIRMDAVAENQPPDENGYYIDNLPAQKYLLTLTIPDPGEEPIVPGWYSDAGYNEADKELFRGIVFPVEVGKTTEIEVQFSQLIVGVLNETGKAVRGSDYPEWAVMVCAGGLAQVADDTLRCASTSIDRRGAATFQIAPGDYHIRVVNDAACYWEFPVKIGLNEAKQEIVTIDSTQTDACLGDK